MPTITELRLAALEDATEFRKGLVVCIRGCHLDDATEAERAAWLAANPPFMSGPVRVVHILDDAEEG